MDVTAEEKLSTIIIDMMNDKFNDGTKYTSDTRTEITKEYLNKILDYIKDNTKVTISYTGTITETGNPDPVIMDIVNVKITKNHQNYTGVTFDEWISHIMESIYNNVFVSNGAYLDQPLVQTNLFNVSIKSLTPVTIRSYQSNVKTAYDNDCDDNGRLKDDADIVKDCQVSLLTDILNTLRAAVSNRYAAQNNAGSSSGLGVVSIITIT